jgi:arylsulfatase A-like enzyme
VDAWLGHFLDRLADLGLAENTLLVLISDHGVLLGEYGWVGKRYDEIHEELCHVPFLIRHPQGKAAGRTSHYYASTHDVGPTVLAALGREVPGHMDGVDLSRLLDGRSPGRARPYWTTCYNDHVAASDGRWLLIADNQGREKRLYARSNERLNVARGHAGQVSRLWGYVRRDAGPNGLPRFKL